MVAFGLMGQLSRLIIYGKNQGFHQEGFHVRNEV